MNPPHPEPLQLLLEVPEPATTKRRREPISEELAAWVARKRRERAGLPLRGCDREQIQRQLEDL